MARRTFFPSTKRDKCLFSVMLFGIPFAIFWLWTVVKPYYEDKLSSNIIIHIFSGMFIFFNVFGNMLLLIRTDASGKTSLLPSVLKPGWKYCSYCCVNSPPRSYHCVDCNECILKRDHHCKFAGCCVGYHNQRYFILVVFYVCIGAVYGVWFQWDFALDAIQIQWYYLPIVMLAPHFCWLFGFITLWGMLVTILHTLGVTTFLSSGYMLYLQIKSLLKGQTQYEIKHNINDYNLSFKETFVDVFGSRWYLVWLSPFINSALRGDGLEFTKKKEQEQTKHL